MTTLEQRQIAHIEKLITRQQAMTRLTLGDDFMTVSVAEIRGAMAEAEDEHRLAEQGIVYMDPTVAPPESELEPGQVWVWLAGATPQHWEIKDTGVVLLVCERCGEPIMWPAKDSNGDDTNMCGQCVALLEEHGP